MHPAQCVLADSELAGIIADNYRLAQEAVRLDACEFACNIDPLRGVFASKSDPL
jgi:hypothetical protein